MVDEEEGENKSVVENTPVLSKVLELREKLHLFVSIRQPQQHTLISHLKLQLNNIYLDSKVTKDSSMKNYFNNC